MSLRPVLVLLALSACQSKDDTPEYRRAQTPLAELEQSGDGVLVALQGEVDAFVSGLQIPDGSVVGVLPPAYLPGPANSPMVTAPRFSEDISEFVAKRLAASAPGLDVLPRSELMQALRHPDDNLPQTFRLSTAIPVRGRLGCVDVVIFGEYERREISAGLDELQLRLTAFDVVTMTQTGRELRATIPWRGEVRQDVTMDSPWKVVDELTIDPRQDWPTELGLMSRAAARELQGQLRGIDRDSYELLVTPLNLEALGADFGCEDYATLFEGERLLQDTEGTMRVNFAGSEYGEVELGSELARRRAEVIATNAHAYAQRHGRIVAGALQELLPRANVRSDQGDDPTREGNLLRAMATKRWGSYAEGLFEFEYVPDIIAVPVVRKTSNQAYELMVDFYWHGFEGGKTMSRSVMIHENYGKVLETALADGKV